MRGGGVGKGDPGRGRRRGGTEESRRRSSDLRHLLTGGEEIDGKQERRQWGSGGSADRRRRQRESHRGCAVAQGEWGMGLGLGQRGDASWVFLYARSVGGVGWVGPLQLVLCGGVNGPKPGRHCSHRAGPCRPTRWGGGPRPGTMYGPGRARGLPGRAVFGPCRCSGLSGGPPFTGLDGYL
jgi:hypothetical protein